MKRDYVLRSALRTAKLGRLIAKGIDLSFILLLTFSFYPVGLVAGILYQCLADSLGQGQSLGKKIIGFAVISLEDGLPCSAKQSLIRNLPFCIPMAFGLIPLWGWFLCFALGALLFGLELYLLATLDSGHRLGDVMADTTVIANDPHGNPTKKKSDSWFDNSEIPI